MEIWAEYFIIFSLMLIVWMAVIATNIRDRFLSSAFGLFSLSLLCFEKKKLKPRWVWTDANEVQNEW